MQIFKKVRKYGLVILVLLVMVTGSVKYLSHLVKVSSNVNGKELPISSVETKEKKIALTFDASWSNEDTKDILSTLKTHNIHATFFLTGEWATDFPDEVKAIQAAGHDLGNHSMDHKNMSQMSVNEQRQELIGVHKKVKELSGTEMNLFRPPYGDYNDDVIKTATSCGYYSISWNVDSLDWKDYGVDSIIDTVCKHKNLGNGAIILCHNGTKYTAKALEGLITKLQEAGYEIVPVSQLIYKDNYHMDVDGRQIKNK